MAPAGNASRMTPVDGLPLACSLTASELQTRRATILALFRGAALTTEPIENGLRLTFPGDSAVLEAILETIRLERECCQFLRFELTLEPQKGAVTLTLTGPTGTREFLASELGLTCPSVAKQWPN